MEPAERPRAAFGGAGPALSERLELHVRRLAGYIGERNILRPEALARAALYIEQTWTGAGYRVRREEYPVGDGTCRNLFVETEPAGTRRPLLIIGAHYDSAPGTPGADDNASGVAVLLELAAAVRRSRLPMPARFVSFASEEPPHFATGEMGSAFHAKRLRADGTAVAGMLSLEMLGYYDSRPGSQAYPPFLARFYPESADFLALVSDFGSRDLIKRMAEGLRREGVRIETAALPRWVPGVSLSDHLSFWKESYPAAMLTDTAMYRNPHYHMPTDTPETLDYPRMALLVEALRRTLRAW
ncbi:MAG: M28 family peptidase [Elusimicrobiota bacterium]